MSDINKLLEIMKALRNPESGCPWDLEQDFRSIYPYTIEEAYEVADAIDRKNWPELMDELGDLLLQVVFHTQMASELGLSAGHAIVLVRPSHRRIATSASPNMSQGVQTRFS
jgi:NTP pyrophosphatase (non-canonical NTP hydrolase)